MSGALEWRAGASARTMKGQQVASDRHRMTGAAHSRRGRGLFLKSRRRSTRRRARFTPRPLHIIALCLIVAVVSVVLTRAVAMPGPDRSHRAQASTGPDEGTGGDTGSEDTGGEGSGGEVPDGESPAPDSPDPDDGAGDEPTAPGDASTRPAPTPAAPPVPPAPSSPPANPPPAGSPTTRPPQPPTTPPTSPPATVPSPSPAPAASYEAEARGNVLTGTARAVACSGCSGGKKIGHLGNGTATLQFTGVRATTAGPTVLTLAYVNGGSAPRTAELSVNGGPATTLTFPVTRDWNTTATLRVTVTLNAGANTVKFSDAASAPDFDKLTVG
jgi:hypothetical protein